MRNHYRDGMPLSEKITKDLQDWGVSMVHQLRKNGAYRKVLCYPDYPSKKTTIHKICRKLGWRLSNKPTFQADTVLFFHDQTFKSSDHSVLSQYSRVLNGNCDDISKEKVDEAHQGVFGYNTFIDPMTYHGRALQKSNENAQHDGTEVDCPIEQPAEGSIYQLIIDNQEGEEFVDMRVPVIGDSIPLVYRKYKSAEQRYTNEVIRSTLHTTDDQLSLNEQTQVLAFCKEMKADFCELDILRNKADGRIYIIDLNTTPYGPPAGLAQLDNLKAIKLLSESFFNLAKG
ncbi:MAG: hypothetical protein HRT74_06855 [Flavobacteriales bacterium]|nr:hypothetical protein [Flavobacteriales bacterium]